MNKKVLGLLLLLISFNGVAQNDSVPEKLIKVTGKVIDSYNRPVSNLVVVNLDTYLGVFGQLDGSFEIDIKQDERISFRSYGKTTKTITFSDSIPKSEYYLVIKLEDLNINLNRVEIIAPRDLAKIHDDFQTLGYDKSDYIISGVDAAQSPITFLYQQFSAKAKDKREAAELNNNARKRELLKELFGKYADFGILDLKDDEFDDFIDFMHVPDSFMKSSSQYEFVVFVKQRFAEYKIYHRSRGLQDSDYDYDK